MSSSMLQSFRLNRRRFMASSVLASPVMAAAVQRTRAQTDLPAIEIISPFPGAVVTGDTIEVQVDIAHFVADCAMSGRPDADGVGHIHVMLDGMTMANLTNFYCSDSFQVSLAGLDAGTHTLMVMLASNTHLGMMETLQQVEFDYQPVDPVALPDPRDLGEPGITLVSPLDGAQVPAVLDVEVSPENFVPSAEFAGKPNVPGYGHYHVFVDTPMGMMGGMDDMRTSAGTATSGMSDTAPMDAGMAMMSMAGMVLMPGSNRFELDLTAWGPGDHTIWIEPVQNDHTMFESFGHVEFTVRVEA